MKNQLRRLLLTIGLSAVLGSSLLNAQTTGKIGGAEISFTFQIADRVLPPGTYTISAHANGLMELWNGETRQHTMFVAGSYMSDKQANPRLVFNRYGDRYFLSQVWVGSDATGHVLPKGHLEKEIAGTAQTPGSLTAIRIK